MKKERIFKCYLCKKDYRCNTKPIIHSKDIKSDDDLVILCDKCKDAVIKEAKKQGLIQMFINV